MNSIDNQTLGIGLCITCFPNHFLVRLTRSGITWNLTSMHWIFEKTFNCVQKLSEPDQDQKVRVFHPFWIIFIGNPTHLRRQETHRLPQALVCAQELLEYGYVNSEYPHDAWSIQNIFNDTSLIYIHLQIWKGHDLATRSKRSGSRICTCQKSHRGGALQGAGGSNSPLFLSIHLLLRHTNYQFVI